MKLKFVITSIIAIVSFVGISSAQSGSVQFFDTFQGGVFVGLTPVTPTSSPVSGPNLNAFAGRTIRLRIASTNNVGDERYVYVLMGTPPAVTGCNPDSLFTTPVAGTGGAVAGIVIAATSDNNRVVEYKVRTDVAWKGTCRVISVRRGDGSEYLGRIYFQ